MTTSDTSDSIAVVVEARLDGLLLRRLLGRGLSARPQFYAGEGGILLASLARNILVHDGSPVLLVLDAESTHPEKVEETCELSHFLLRQVAHDRAFQVFAFVPQVEVIFFEAPGVLRRHCSSDLAELELELGRVDPRRTLERLLARCGRTRESFYRELSDEDLDALLTGKQAARFAGAADELSGVWLGAHSS